MIFSARLEQMTCERPLGIGDERRHGPAIKEVKTGCRMSASGKQFGAVQERKRPSRTSFFIKDDLPRSLSLAVGARYSNGRSTRFRTRDCCRGLSAC